MILHGPVRAASAGKWNLIQELAYVVIVFKIAAARSVEIRFHKDDLHVCQFGIEVMRVDILGICDHHNLVRPKALSELGLQTERDLRERGDLRFFVNELHILLFPKKFAEKANKKIRAKSSFVGS